ncbi:MAG: opacity protein-like surface antigen [Nonlabens sp.]|jgi:opacity protein-like surface antigen
MIISFKTLTLNKYPPVEAIDASMGTELINFSGDLGGTSPTPGNYQTDSTILIQEGDLTLDALGDANAIWSFQTKKGIVTIGGLGGNVILKGGAQIENVFWKTNHKIHLGANTSFAGNIERIITGNHSSRILEGIQNMVRNGMLAIQSNFKSIKAMKTNNNSKKEWSKLPPFNLSIILVIFSAIFMLSSLTPLQAQEEEQDEYARPSWHFGAVGAGNFNFYRGTTQQLTDELLVPTAFRHGDGLGLYLGPTIEFYKEDAIFGFMLQAAYDSRKGDFDQVTTACNCPADLATDLNYISIEPSLRVAPFRSNFYLYVGPRIAFNRAKSFTYALGINPLVPDQTPTADVIDDFCSIDKMLVSMQVGAGYDIELSSKYHKSQFVLSPFVALHPQFGQDPRTTETWHLTTLRAGVALKFGRGKKIEKEEEITEEPYILVPPTVYFSLISPKNLPVDRRVRETFPVLNYVFFDLGNTKIPDRYVQLNKEQVVQFKIDQLEVFTPKALTGRSAREMVVYYNVLNILGDRMNLYPETTIKLIGASEVGKAESTLMAESVKQYLVDIFSIKATRIAVETREDPKIPEVQPGATKELKLLNQGDRRVSIESSSPKLLMEFQSGPDVPLKPLELTNVHEAPVDSYVSMRVDSATEVLSSWSIEVKDNKGVIQRFGPYTEDEASIPGKNILGTRTNGNFKVTMIGLANNGTKIVQDTTIQMVLWKPKVDEQGIRYSVVYGFNDSNATDIYYKYLTDIVAPQITEGATVILHGYTDVIGDPAYNQKLSLARANDVRSILEKSLAISKTKNITFRVIGLGESIGDMPFGNKLPEQRFYNRTVIIDIILLK